MTPDLTGHERARLAALAFPGENAPALIPEDVTFLALAVLRIVQCRGADGEYGGGGGSCPGVPAPPAASPPRSSPGSPRGEGGRSPNPPAGSRRRRGRSSTIRPSG